MSLGTNRIILLSEEPRDPEELGGLNTNAGSDLSSKLEVRVEEAAVLLLTS